MDIFEEIELDPEAHIVWINEEKRIASFHAVDGDAEQIFASHEFFMNFLHSLQERSFRFQ